MFLYSQWISLVVEAHLFSPHRILTFANKTHHSVGTRTATMMTVVTETEQRECPEQNQYEIRKL